MPRLVEAVPGTRFLVAGSGTHEPELRRQAAELGLDEHGTFLGWIGDDVLHSLYPIADVCVVPSIYEPFGLVALEAMASGCPCIVADTGGLREVVPHGEAGLRFRARDAQALGEMVERLLTDAELRERLVAEGSEHILRFDWADVAALDRRGLRRAGRRPDPRLNAVGLGERPIGCRVLSAAGSGSTGSGQRSSRGASRMRSSLAGTPPTTAFAGTSLVRTEFVPTIELSPTLTPRRTQAP